MDTPLRSVHGEVQILEPWAAATLSLFVSSSPSTSSFSLLFFFFGIYIRAYERFFFSFVIITDEVRNDNLRPRQILPDTWRTFRKSIVVYNNVVEYREKERGPRDRKNWLAASGIYRKIHIYRRDNHSSMIRNVHVVIWINPSITCLAPETFAQTRAY